MAITDPGELEKLHSKLNASLAAWETDKLAELVKILRQSEAEVSALLVRAEISGWEHTRLESLLSEIDLIMDRAEHQAELWVKGQTHVQAGSPLASLVQFPAELGGTTALQILGIAGTFSVIHLPVVRYMIDYDLALIKNLTTEAMAQVKSVLQQGYIQGEGIADIAKRLRNTRLDKGVWPTVEKRATVIARTEILRASNQGALAVYRSYGIKRVKWLTAEDERVCPICGGLHDRVFMITELPFGGPPSHPQCRCYVVAVIATTEEEGRAYDQVAAENLKWWQEKQAA